jgi:flagellin-like hook-associated protein FlgL
MGTVTVSNNGNGTLTIDLSALPAGVTAAGAGNYKVQSANGSTASTPLPITVGSGYSLADIPVVTLSGPAAAGVSVASSTVNPNGTVGIAFSGTPATAGPISVSVSNGSGGGQTAGLTNEDLNLWDFSVMDFTRYIQVLANVRSVNGAESSSFNFSDTLLTTNWENLEMAASRLTDTDIALELIKVAKNRFKTSTAADLLAKHNNLGTMVDLTVMNLA